MGVAAIIVDLLANVLVLLALFLGWRAVYTAESKTVARFQEYWDLTKRLTAGEIPTDDADRQIKALGFSDGVYFGSTFESAPLVAQRVELAILRHAKPALTVPIILGTIGTALGIVAASLALVALLQT